VLSDFAQGMWVGIAITLGTMVIFMLVVAMRQVAKKNREGQ
jgi:hypothetical protein